jgi:putative membrane protein
MMHATELTLTGLLRALGASSAFALVGIIVFMVAFFAMQSLLPFSVRKEIEEDHNTALAILMSSVIIGLAIIIASAVGT